MKQLFFIAVISGSLMTALPYITQASDTDASTTTAATTATTTPTPTTTTATTTAAATTASTTDENSLSVQVGQTASISTLPSGVSFKAKGYNSKLISVKQHGKNNPFEVKGKKQGTTTITFTSKGKNKTQPITYTVTITD